MMGNPARGEVAVDFRGKSINLKLTTNAVCTLEAVHDKSLSQLLIDLRSDPRITIIRAVYRAMMLNAVPDASLEDAGDLIDGLDPDQQMEVFTRAVEVAFPKTDDADGEADRAGK